MNQEFVVTPIVKRTVLKDNAIGIQSGPKRVIMKEKINKTPKQDKFSGNYMKSTEAYRNSVFLGTQKHQSTVEHYQKQIIGQFTHQSPDSIAMPSTPILTHLYSNIDNQSLSTKKGNFVQIKWRPAASPVVHPRTPTKAVRSDEINKMISLYSNGIKSKNKQLTKMREKMDDLLTKKTAPMVSPPLRDHHIFQNSQQYAHKRISSSTTTTPRRMANNQINNQKLNEKISTPSTRLEYMFESSPTPTTAQGLPSQTTTTHQPLTAIREEQLSKDDIKAHLTSRNELQSLDHHANTKRSLSVPPRHSTGSTSTTTDKNATKYQQTKKKGKKPIPKKRGVIPSTSSPSAWGDAEKGTTLSHTSPSPPSHLKHTMSSTIRSHSPLSMPRSTATSTATPSRTPRSPSSHSSPFLTPSRSTTTAAATIATILTTTTNSNTTSSSSRYSTPQRNHVPMTTITTTTTTNNNNKEKDQTNLIQRNLFASNNKLDSPVNDVSMTSSITNLHRTPLNSNSLLSPSLSLTDDDDDDDDDVDHHQGMSGNSHLYRHRHRHHQQYTFPHRPDNDNSLTQQPPSDTHTLPHWDNELEISGDVTMGVVDEDQDQEEGGIMSSSTFSASSISFSASLSSQSSTQLLFTKMRTTSFPVFPPPPPPPSSTSTMTMTTLLPTATRENNAIINNLRKGDCDIRRDEDISFGSEESSVDREGTDTISFIDCTFDSMPSSGQLDDSEGRGGGNGKAVVVLTTSSPTLAPTAIYSNQTTLLTTHLTSDIATTTSTSLHSLTHLSRGGLEIMITDTSPINTPLPTITTITTTTTTTTTTAANKDFQANSRPLSTFHFPTNNFFSVDDSASDSDSVHNSELDTAFINSMSHSASSSSLHSTSYSYTASSAPALRQSQDRLSSHAKRLSLPATGTTRRSLSLFSTTSSSIGSLVPGEYGPATLLHQHISGISLSSRDVHRLPSSDSTQVSYDTSINTLTHPLNTALCMESTSNSYDYDAEWIADLDLVSSIPTPSNLRENSTTDTSNLEQSSWSEDSNLSGEYTAGITTNGGNRQVDYSNLETLKEFDKLQIPMRRGGGAATVAGVTAAHWENSTTPIEMNQGYYLNERRSNNTTTISNSKGGSSSNSVSILFSNNSNNNKISDVDDSPSSQRSHRASLKVASSQILNNNLLSMVDQQQNRADSPTPPIPSSCHHSNDNDHIISTINRDLEDPVAKLLHHSDFRSIEQYYFEPLKIPYKSGSSSSSSSNK